jgi:hypothetical protein
VSIKILCDAPPISADPISADPISAVLIAAVVGGVAPPSFFSPYHNCSRNDPELGVAVGTASKAACLGAGVLVCILAVVVAQKLSRSNSDHQSCSVETDVMPASHMKLEAMQCATGLVQMQVGDDWAVVVALENGTTVRVAATQLHWIAVA